MDIHVGAVTERCGRCRGSRKGVGLAPPHFQPYKGALRAATDSSLKSLEIGTEEMQGQMGPTGELLPWGL